jgi:glycerol-3-phosphate acyltransferase PlsY
MELAVLYLYAYSLGAVPTAYLIGRLVRGIDLRHYGSGNVGGANVFQNVGKRWVVPVGIFEVFAKGCSPIWIGKFVLDLDVSSSQLMGAALLVVAGNNWSMFLRFQGGRGIVVAGGALFALAYRELILFVAVAMGGWAVFRSSGVWVLLSLLFLPLWSYLLGEPLAITWFCIGLVALVSAKRITSNWTRPPESISLKEVLFNRLIFDRDVAKREEWLARNPGENGWRAS